MEQTKRLIRWPEVQAKVNKSRTQIWRDIRAGLFPAPVQIGPNAVAWESDAIDSWVASRPRVSWAPKPETSKAA